MFIHLVTSISGFLYFVITTFLYIVLTYSDTGITWETFLGYHMYHEDDPLLDVGHLRTQFRLLDLDGSDHVSWYEFLTHEAGIKLSYRNQVCEDFRVR